MCLMPAANAKDTASKTCSELDLKVPRPMRGISTPFLSLMVRSSIFLTKWFEGLEEIEDLNLYDRCTYSGSPATQWGLPRSRPLLLCSDSY